jgi:hypothetical protein
LEFWQSISQCIDYVAKVTTLTPKHCDDLTNHKQYCLKKLGFDGAFSFWTEESFKKVQPCVQLLTANTQPSPNDYRNYDQYIKTKDTPHDQGLRDMTVRFKVLKRSLYSAMQKSIKANAGQSPESEQAIIDKYRDEYSQLYGKIMMTCQANATVAKASEIMETIEAEGLHFQF